MSSKGQDNPGSGCALIILAGIAVVILAWAIKIGLVILGVVLIVGGALGGVALVLMFWFGVSERPKAQAALSDFDATLAELSTTSARRLSSALTSWDDLQRNRGVGTTLEKAYFAESVDEVAQALFDDINTHMKRGEELLAAAEHQLDREQRIEHLHQQDLTTLHLEMLRRQVS